jgi:hypothetical protein
MRFSILSSQRSQRPRSTNSAPKPTKPKSKSQFVRAAWENLESVEEKLLALKSEDSSILNDISDGYVLTPLMGILAYQGKKRFTPEMLEQIKALLAKEGYKFKIKSKLSENTILQWAMDENQFAVAKEILSAALTKQYKLRLRPVQSLLYLLTEALPLLNKQPLKADAQTILSEIIQLLDFLEEQKAAIRGANTNPDIGRLNTFVKAYGNVYLENAEELARRPEKEIDFLITVYEKTIQGIEGEKNFIEALRKLTVTNRIYNNFTKTVRDLQKKHLPQEKGITVDPIINNLLDKLSLLMEEALTKYSLKQKRTPFFILLNNIKEAFESVCSMPVQQEIITPFVQAIQAAQPEEKQEEGVEGAKRELLGEVAIKFIQDTIQAISKKPSSFTEAALKEQVTKQESLDDGIKAPIERLFMALYKEAISKEKASIRGEKEAIPKETDSILEKKEVILNECQKIEEQVRTLIKDQSIRLAASTKKYIENWLDEMAQKRTSTDGLQVKDVEKFNKAMGNLPNLPPELKATLAALIISLLACAALIATASIAVIPVGAVAVMVAGGYSITQAFNQRNGLKKISTIMERAPSVADFPGEQKSNNEQQGTLSSPRKPSSQ